MNTQSTPPNQTHQEMARLLPWYVNKSLAAEELKAVENHLATCLLCKREISQLQKLARAIRHNHSLDSAAQASFVRLKKRIRASQDDRDEAAQLHASPLKLSDSLLVNKIHVKHARKLFDFTALAIAATLLLALALPFNQPNSQDFSFQNNFRTLSDGQSEKLKPNEIRVVFADNVGEADRSRILAAINGKLVGQPSPQGVYTASLPEKTTAPGIISAIAKLRQDKRVIFAEPAYALLSSRQPGEPE